MKKSELLNLINDIIKIKSESNNIEIKAAYKGCPEKLYDTLSSFSNQDSGGTILFGIDERKDYQICGVYSVEDLQKKISEQCKQMEPPVRAVFENVEIDGKYVVSAEIPGMSYYERPCFYRGLGKYRGSYIRVGDMDEIMTEFEIYSIESYKKRVKDDLRTIDSSDIKLFDEKKYNKYLDLVKSERENLTNNVSNDDIADLMGLKSDGKATLSSVMVFSKYPQTYFPQYSIIAVSIPGQQKGDIGVFGERFIDNKRLTGPIDDMLEEGMNFVKRNIKYKTIIKNDGKREDMYEYPLKAIREALLNALVHRDYSRYTEGTPISLDIYSDRIEITNPGGLYGGINVDDLGDSRPETRNIILSNILEILGITENRYSGIPTIRKELRDMNMPAPIFSSKKGEFKIIIKKEYGEDENSVFEKVLQFCESPKSRDEITSFLEKSKNYVISKIIQPLVNSEQLEMTVPDKPKSSLQKYYTKKK